MSDTAFKNAFEPPDGDEEEDLVEGQGQHVEFISEIGEVLDMPNVDQDGYVGPDNRMQPHQSPTQVEEDAGAELESHLHEVPEEAEPLDDVRDLEG